MKPTVLITGRSFKEFERYLESQGYDYLVLGDQLLAKSELTADFSSRESLLRAVDALPRPIDAVTSMYENYVLPAAWICEHLGLPGLPVNAALACTDKQRMRQAFAQAPEPISPAFQVVTSKKDLEAFANQHNFPLILKPANLAKSLLVTKNHDLSELLANYDKMLQSIGVIYERYAPHRQPKILMEEFLEGTIHSVDAFIDDQGQVFVLNEVVDYQTGYDIGHNDNFHYSRLLPSKLSADDQAKLCHVAKLGCQALGMKSSPAHIEIIMTPHGPRIVEIGARNGGYRERMHRFANGIDIAGAALDVAMGKMPNIKATKNEPCAVLELFPKQPGIFKGLRCEAELRKLDSLVYLSIKAKPGRAVGLSSEGHKMCAVIILHNPDPQQFAKDLTFVNNNVRVELA